MSKTVELARECQRQYENCLYSATSMLIWVSWLRWVKVFFVVAPIVLGSIGSWKVLASGSDENVRMIAAIFSFAGGLLSTLYSALKLDTHITDFSAAAGELTNLRDRFRQAALVTSQKPFNEFEAEFSELRERIDAVRAKSLTAPNLCFVFAQRKIRKGDYSFDLDKQLPVSE